MTHTTSVQDEFSDGSYRTVLATVTISSLDRANEEDFDPGAELGESPATVTIVGSGGAADRAVRFDHTTKTLHFTNDDGTDAAQGSSPGPLLVRLSGPGSA